MAEDPQRAGEAQDGDEARTGGAGTGDGLLNVVPGTTDESTGPDAPESAKAGSSGAGEVTGAGGGVDSGGSFRDAPTTGGTGDMGPGTGSGSG